MKNLIAALILTLFVVGQAFSQQRFLISPRDEVVPLTRDAAAASVIARRTEPRLAGAVATCGREFVFGFPEDKFPASSNFGAYHKDLIGEWVMAKAAGRIDTIYWESLGSVGALDSLIRIRIHRSIIGPALGPGIRPGPYDPPCQNWGYWLNTNDEDQGIAPFLEEATDSTWISTYGGLVASVPPVDGLLWDATVVDHANRINQVPIRVSAESLHVEPGDLLFISFRVNGPSGHTVDARTEFAASAFRVQPDDENYPSRIWKFYEHDSGPSNCSSFPPNSMKRGWIARGGFTEDTLDVAAYNIWYSMTVSSNVPPDVASATIINNTFDTTAQYVEAMINDCNPAYPAQAGVASANIVWQLNGVPQPDIPMTHDGGDNWTAFIPGMPPGSIVSYKICAYDSAGMGGCGPQITYVIFSPRNSWYFFDTAATCVQRSIAATGTAIPKSSFFLPPDTPPTELSGWHRTAGPFDMGREMVCFRERYRYLWVGVDGMISLTKSATDTVQLSDYGAFPANWSFAGGVGAMPRTLIAPFLANLGYGDTLNTCGAMRYQLSYGGDSCLVIVEWDSTSFIPVLSSQPCDETVFRTVMNTCDGTIEFQYDNVGGLALDSSASVGLKDSNSFTAPQVGIVYVNDHAHPYSTKPRNGWCVKFYPTTVVAVGGGGSVPNEFALGLNYPNPFNPATTFEVRIPTVAHVSLKIYDIVGREVATLLDEVKTPGVYIARWDAGNSPTGAYFARMSAAGDLMERKIVLTR